MVRSYDGGVVALAPGSHVGARWRALGYRWTSTTLRPQGGAGRVAHRGFKGSQASWPPAAVAPARRWRARWGRLDDIRYGGSGWGKLGHLRHGGPQMMRLWPRPRNQQWRAQAPSLSLPKRSDLLI